MDRRQSYTPSTFSRKLHFSFLRLEIAPDIYECERQLCLLLSFLTIFFVATVTCLYASLDGNRMYRHQETPCFRFVERERFKIVTSRPIKCRLLRKFSCWGVLFLWVISCYRIWLKKYFSFLSLKGKVRIVYQCYTCDK